MSAALLLAPVGWVVKSSCYAGGLLAHVLGVGVSGGLVRLAHLGLVTVKL